MVIVLLVMAEMANDGADDMIMDAITVTTADITPAANVFVASEAEERRGDTAVGENDFTAPVDDMVGKGEGMAKTESKRAV